MNLRACFTCRTNKLNRFIFRKSLHTHNPHTVVCLQKCNFRFHCVVNNTHEQFFLLQTNPIYCVQVLSMCMLFERILSCFLMFYRSIHTSFRYFLLSSHHSVGDKMLVFHLMHTNSTFFASGKHPKLSALK